MPSAAGLIVAINRSFQGYEYRAGEPFEVTRGKIREFAEALGDPNPAYRDHKAAQQLGHPDVIAPPTFPIVITGIGDGGSPIFDPEFGMDYERVLHGEQKFSYERPIAAGDLLSLSGRIAEIRDAGPHELIRAEIGLRDTAGALVCTATNVLISRDTAVERER